MMVHIVMKMTNFNCMMLTLFLSNQTLILLLNTHHCLYPCLVLCMCVSIDMLKLVESHISVVPNAVMLFAQKEFMISPENQNSVSITVLIANQSAASATKMFLTRELHSDTFQLKFHAGTVVCMAARGDVLYPRLKL